MFEGIQNFDISKGFKGSGLGVMISAVTARYLSLGTVVQKYKSQVIHRQDQAPSLVGKELVDINNVATEILGLVESLDELILHTDSLTSGVLRDERVTHSESTSKTASIDPLGAIANGAMGNKVGAVQSMIPSFGVNNNQADTYDLTHQGTQLKRAKMDGLVRKDAHLKNTQVSGSGKFHVGG